MIRAMPMLETRMKLTRLPEDFEQDPDLGAVAITRRGKPILAVMPWELYEATMKCLNILDMLLEHADLMVALHEILKEVEVKALMSTELFDELLNEHLE
jgi:antitoxin YefM